jgi:hypothetical protein
MELIEKWNVPPFEKFPPSSLLPETAEPQRISSGVKITARGDGEIGNRK